MTLCLFFDILLAQDIMSVSELHNLDKNERIAIKITCKIQETDTDSINVRIKKVDDIKSDNEWVNRKLAFNNNILHLGVNSQEPIYLSIKSVFKDQKDKLLLLEPGDDINIEVKNGHLNFSGKGSAKLRLQYLISEQSKRINLPPNHSDVQTTSMQEDLEWHQYLNRKSEA
ncbi:MAG: hypothetical protein ABWZ79_21610, partial [Pedobacter agri]